MKIEYVSGLESLENINFHEKENYLPIEKICIGSKAEQHLQKNKLSFSDTVRIENSILNFYLELLQQIKKRFHFSRNDLKLLSIITPSRVLPDHQTQIEPLLYHFSNLFEFDEDVIVQQWKILRFSKLDLKRDMDIEDFWKQVSDHKNGMGEHCFKDLTNLVQNLITLPHSSAAAERQFSELNLIKTKLRNKLSLKTINNIILAKELCTSRKPNYVWSAAKENL
uniref:HAT C-terminal dimerisation domain-containing protein n=1 Tax=Bactrocera latifrons TaxID=174628 RepID=A0A0K8TVQ5_BACLA